MADWPTGIPGNLWLSGVFFQALNTPKLVFGGPRWGSLWCCPRPLSQLGRGTPPPHSLPFGASCQAPQHKFLATCIFPGTFFGPSLRLLLWLLVSMVQFFETGKHYNIHSFIHSFISGMHHYECAVPNVDIILQNGRFWAMSIASFRERFSDSRSCWVVFIHIVWWRPGGFLQFSKLEADKVCLASDSYSIHAIWPNRETPCLNSSWRMRL